MDWDRLEAFRAVARTGGFSRAAAELHKTQPAVSQAVAALERELGQPLFDRDGRRIRPTEAGRVLLGRADEAFAALDVAREELGRLGRLETGTLRLGTSDTAASYLLPPVFAAYREQYPKIELYLDNHPSPDIAARVADAELDVGFVTLPPAEDIDPRLIAEPLLTREDVLVCAPGHPLARRRRLSVRELEDQPLLLLHRGTGSRAFIDRAFERAGIRPRVLMEMGSVEVLKRLAELDFGVSIVPRFAVARELGAGSLVARRVFPARTRCRLGVVTRRRGIVPKPAEAFIEVARAAFGAHGREASPRTGRPSGVSERARCPDRSDSSGRRTAQTDSSSASSRR